MRLPGGNDFAGQVVFRTVRPQDDFAGGILFHCDAFFGGGFPIPIAQAIAAEAREIHKIDVLHIRPVAQMLREAPEGGGFEFSLCLLVHAHVICSLSLASVALFAARLG